MKKVSYSELKYFSLSFMFSIFGNLGTSREQIDALTKQVNDLQNTLIATQAEKDMDNMVDPELQLEGVESLPNTFVIYLTYHEMHLNSKVGKLSGIFFG